MIGDLRFYENRREEKAAVFGFAVLELALKGLVDLILDGAILGIVVAKKRTVSPSGASAESAAKAGFVYICTFQLMAILNDLSNRVMTKETH